MAEHKPLSHFLVPKHELVSAEERSKVMKEYSVNYDSMPKIKLKDPALADLGAKVGDMVKITRLDSTSKNIHYRMVAAD